MEEISSQFIAPEDLQGFEIDREWYHESKDYGGPIEGLKVAISVMTKLGVRGGFVKKAESCGNTSVAMGVAERFFKKYFMYGWLKVVVINSGSGGDKTYVYGYSLSDHRTFLIEEDRPKKDDPVVSPQFTNWGIDGLDYKLKSNSQTVEEACARRVSSLQKYKDLPIIGVITGPLRVAYFKSSIETQIQMDKTMRSNYFGNLLKNDDKSPVFISQEEEGYYEQVGTCAMYDNLKKIGVADVSIVAVLGIGGSSSQFTALNQKGETITSIEFPVGMRNETEENKLSQLPLVILERLEETQFFEMIDAMKSSGENPLIGFKSGCVLLLDEFPQKMKALVEHRKYLPHHRRAKKLKAFISDIDPVCLHISEEVD